MIHQSARRLNSIHRMVRARISHSCWTMDSAPEFRKRFSSRFRADTVADRSMDLWPTRQRPSQIPAIAQSGVYAARACSQPQHGASRWLCALLGAGGTQRQIAPRRAIMSWSLLLCAGLTGSSSISSSVGTGREPTRAARTTPPPHYRQCDARWGSDRMGTASAMHQHRVHARLGGAEF
jgi:hypothetical protein